MSRKQPQNTTPIEELLDLDDIPTTIRSGNPEYDRKMAQENHEREAFTKGPIKNKVRNNVDFRQAMNGGSHQQYPQQYHQQYPQQEDNYQLGPRAIQEEYTNTNRNIEYFTHPLTCVDVSNHISSCPICSRIYNEDKTPYLIGIALLVIIIIILIKKIIEKPS